VTTVHLGLGSNLGDREGYLRSALQEMEKRSFRVEAVSSVYQTEPVGPIRDQPLFLNCVVRGSYPGSARSLLRRIGEVESRLGRERIVPQGPRTIDVDILYFGSEIIDEPPDLIVPHPAIGERGFVLLPLAQIDPDLVHPAVGKTQRELLAIWSDRNRSGTAIEELGPWSIVISPSKE
jgi:2-amino-4-hydroxy-6-hydroxymethyldihydropteridine diphosphokinase